ncbi:MAG: 23S rRNA (uracil(1939)-C(5))-methyltransferase RlmD [Bacteroidales bacterium]|nr:23S rRNA (uracil(1939)-C(5))-methyltransferase RlmD [Bacteroidales bacterium]
MSRKRNKEKIIIENVSIEAVAAEGNGLAHIDGKVLFVPKCVPGDVVNVQLTRKRKGFMQGNVIEMVKESPIRQKPFCPHYGICGGCTWQSLPYSKQLEFKQQQVYDQLTRIGHLTLPYLSPILGSEKTQCYRNKLEYTFSDRRWLFDSERFNPDGSERSFSPDELCGIGFHIPQMFSKVLDIKECRLQREPSNKIRLFAKDYAIKHNLQFFDLYNHTGLLRNLVVRTASTGEIMVILVIGAKEIGGIVSSKEISSVKEMLSAIRENFPEITSLWYVVNNKANDSYNDCPIHLFSGKEFITEQMEDISFRIGPKSFYQTNSEQAYRLYSVVREFADLKGDEVLYDLYTGTGTIALFLAKRVKKVVGIEYVEEAISDAKMNAKENGIKNSVFYAGDMKDVLNEEFIEKNGKPDVIVLDPPRAGIHPSVAQVVLKAAPKRIVYVSCNPASQARDLETLCKNYTISKVQPVDMFPHTQHVENVVLLERSNC